MNLVVIPQVLFAGALAPLDGFAELIGKSVIVGHWAYQAFQPMLDEKLPDHMGLDSDAPSLVFSMSMVGLHTFIYSSIFFLAMVKKDGPGGFAKLARAIPRDEKGRIAAGRLIELARGAARG